MDHMQAQHSKSTQFVERWTRSELMYQRMLYVCLLLGIISLAFAGIIMWTVVKPKSIYYVPNVYQAGVALPISDMSMVVSTFVSKWIMDWNNFNPVTASNAYARAQRFMSPYVLSKTRTRLSKDLEEIKQSEISSLLTVIDEPSVKKERGDYKVTIKTKKTLFMGKQMVKEQDITFKILINVVAPTEQNPLGLIVASIDQELSI